MVPFCYEAKMPVTYYSDLLYLTLGKKRAPDLNKSFHRQAKDSFGMPRLWSTCHSLLKAIKG